MIGISTSTTAVLLMKAEASTTRTTISRSDRRLPLAAAAITTRAIWSSTPVRCSAAVSMNRAAMEIGAEFEKARSASSSGIRPKAKQAAAAITAVVTGGTRSMTKEATMPARISSVIASSCLAIQSEMTSSIELAP